MWTVVHSLYSSLLHVAIEHLFAAHSKDEARRYGEEESSDQPEVMYKLLNVAVVVSKAMKEVDARARQALALRRHR